MKKRNEKRKKHTYFGEASFRRRILIGAAMLLLTFSVSACGTGSPGADTSKTAEETEISTETQAESLTETEKEVSTEKETETETETETEISTETETETVPAEPFSPASVEPAPPAPASGTETDPGIVRTDTALYTYNMMVSDLQTIADRYPEHLTLGSAGTTEDGRELFVVGLGNPLAERSFLIVAATHGREYMTAQLVMKQIEFYAANYETGSYNGVPLKELFEKNYFRVMPMVNPDGVSVSELGEAGIRRDDLRANLRSIYASDLAKGFAGNDYAYYLTRWKANANGVDLNRNFSPGWETVNERSAPSSDFYKGPVPGSEKESQALVNVVNEMRHLQAVISYHSYGDLVYWQYGQQEPLWSANRELAQHISNHAGHYLAGYSNEAGFTNWCIRVKGIRAVVVETGRVPTPLPLSEFADLWNRHRYTFAMLSLAVPAME